jgi:alkylation response protein AidB-like acyl-CoA dehydrogenase
VPWPSVPLGSASSVVEAARVTTEWVADHVPFPWRQAAARGGPPAVRAVRTRHDYHDWYPVFGRSGLAVATWPREYGGLGISAEAAKAVADVLAPLDLRPLNQLGLNNTAAALFAWGTEEQRRRYLPPIVTNEERWCQLFSEPGSGSDLASLATRAIRDGSDWLVTGQKVWTTWAMEAEFGILLARTNAGVPKRRGITYFLVDLRQSAITIRPLRQLTGEAEFNEVFLDEARIPDDQRIGDVDNGWTVAASTLSSERHMVGHWGSAAKAGQAEGSVVERLVKHSRDRGQTADPLVRDRLAALWIDDQVRSWTNKRVRAVIAAGHPPGPVASIGKVQQAAFNQRLRVAATDLLGAGALAGNPDSSGAGGDYSATLSREAHAMLRSRANSIEGGTTEINKTILGERVLALPREPDPWKDEPWKNVPRA